MRVSEMQALAFNSWYSRIDPVAYP